MSKSLKLVIFDCDGTLVDSQHMIAAAMQRAYADHDLLLPPHERIVSIIGLSLEQAFARLGEGIPKFPVATLVERYKAAFFALRQSGEHAEPLFPGARETVDILAQRPDVLLGIATGKSQRGVAAVLARHGLADRFHVIKTADDAPSKPHPGMVIDAMGEAGVAPADTVLVGDTVFDMEMARAAGVRAIGVAWGYHPVEALRAAGAQGVIEDFPALIPTLDGMWQEIPLVLDGPIAPRTAEG
jgi:phosphoglycolate phosphatase